MPLVWSIGSIFGPAFGGFFAQPAERYPHLFGNIEFFKRYPFALPNIVACIVFFISLMTGLLFLKETLESKRHDRDWGLVLGEKLKRSFRRSPPKAHTKHRRHSFVDDGASAPLLAQARMSSSERIAVEIDPPSMKEIFTNQTIVNLVSYTFLALHAVAYDQVLPVFLNYPRQVPDETNTQLPFRFSGGFGLNSNKIGTIFTIYGVACGVVQFFFFPALCKRWGVLNLFRFATMVFPFVYLLTPYTALVQDDTLRFAFLMALMLVKGVVVIIGFPCTTILLTNSASSLRILGTLNGFATTFSGIGRAVGPALAGAVFTAGVQKGYIIAPWWLLAGIAMVGAIPSWFIVEGEGPTRSLETDDDDDDEEDDDEESTLLAASNGSSDYSSGNYDSTSDDDELSDSSSSRKKTKSDAAAVRSGGYGTIRSTPPATQKQQQSQML